MSGGFFYIGCFYLSCLFLELFDPFIIPKEGFARKNSAEVFSGRHCNLGVRQTL